MVAHEDARRRLVAQYDAIPAGAPVRLAKRTSNLFRPRDAAAAPGLDVAAFDQVLAVDAAARTADVQAMTTYEHLVDATLAHGLMPTVVPQLRTITIGGAVTGLGIESSSFRAGLPHESVRELEILTGDGQVVTARPEGEHADLFRAFPNSYGTLGYALRLTIDLEPVHPFVAAAARAVPRPGRAHGGGRRRSCATGRTTASRSTSSTAPCSPPTRPTSRLGSWADEAPYTSDYTGHAGLLPVDPAAAGRLPHGARLPLALGHRLVLVLAGLRRAEPAHPPGVAQALAAQRRLLEADPAREPLPRRRPDGRPQGPPAARAGGAGRRDPARPHRRVPPLVPRARCRSSRSGCARSSSATRVRRRRTPTRVRHRGRSTRLRRGVPYVNVGFWSTVAIEGGRVRR